MFASFVTNTLLMLANVYPWAPQKQWFKVQSEHEILQHSRAKLVLQV